MWTRIVIALLLVLSAASSADDLLEEYQRDIYLHHWEQAGETWSSSAGPLEVLMRVDYHQARKETWPGSCSRESRPVG